LNGPLVHHQEHLSKGDLIEISELRSYQEKEIMFQLVQNYAYELFYQTI
jgi:hypothetical protein